MGGVEWPHSGLRFDSAAFYCQSYTQMTQNFTLNARERPHKGSGQLME